MSRRRPQQPREATLAGREVLPTTAPELAPLVAPEGLEMPDPELVAQARELTLRGVLDVPGAASLTVGEPAAPSLLAAVRSAIPGALEALEARLASELAALYAVGY